MKSLNRLWLLLLLAPAPCGAEELAYEPRGRRDPFVSFVTLAGRERPSCPGTGLASSMVPEVGLSGIVQTSRGRRALLVTPDGATQFASEGSRLCDGHVARIEPSAVVFVRRLQDPLLPATEIEVRRLLHPER